MNRDEYRSLLARPTGVPVISAADLESKIRDFLPDSTIPPMFTLLYGYTLKRDTFHVYYDDGQITRHIYNSDETIQDLSRWVWPAEDLVPSKRVYPDRTNYVFARMLKDLGIDIPWTVMPDDSDGYSARDMGMHGQTVE